MVPILHIDSLSMVPTLIGAREIRVFMKILYLFNEINQPYFGYTSGLGDNKVRLLALKPL